MESDNKPTGADPRRPKHEPVKPRLNFIHITKSRKLADGKVVNYFKTNSSLLGEGTLKSDSINFRDILPVIVTYYKSTSEQVFKSE